VRVGSHPDLPTQQLRRLTGLTSLTVPHCPSVVLSTPPFHGALSRLVELRLPSVIFAASAFAELLAELPLLRRLSVSMSVLLLRDEVSDEPAIERYDDLMAFPPDLVTLALHHYQTSAGGVPATWHIHRPPPRRPKPSLPQGPLASFVSDTLTACTLQRLAELLSASSPRLAVLKFKGAYPPGTRISSSHGTPNDTHERLYSSNNDSLTKLHSSCALVVTELETMLCTSALMQLRSLHTIRLNDHHLC
jgi:hypothetical protein